MKTLIATTAISLLAAPVLAEAHATGDAANGEAQFARQCVACHVVVDDAGETLAGRNARTGPNLYGISARVAGSVEDFRYSPAIQSMNEQGAEWTEENFVGYVMDPTAWLREFLDDPRARGNMSFKVRDEQDAKDIYAYLASLAPAE